MIYGNIKCHNPKRLAEVVKPGDMVHTTLFYKPRAGFSTEHAVVTAVHHWGVYVVLRKPEHLPRNYIQAVYDIILKRHFKIKWKHVYGITLK